MMNNPSEASPQPRAEPGAIPQSPLLSEVNPDSLSDLFSRDPLKLGDADIARIVATLRQQREAWAKAEAAGATRAPKASAGPKASKAKGLPGSAEDLGF